MEVRDPEVSVVYVISTPPVLRALEKRYVKVTAARINGHLMSTREMRSLMHSGASGQNAKPKALIIHPPTRECETQSPYYTPPYK